VVVCVPSLRLSGGEDEGVAGTLDISIVFISRFLYILKRLKTTGSFFGGSTICFFKELASLPCSIE
jgi:hypothetical protein